MSDTTLSHTGSGDNVARDKNVVFETYINFVNSTVPENLKSPVKTILRNITNREFIQAREGISLIASIENKNSEVSELLDLLLIKCDIGENNKEAINIGLMQDMISSSKNDMIKDLALSLLYRAEVISFGVDIAIKRYNACKFIGPYSRSATFELFTDRKNLLNVFNENIFTIIEEEFIGLINGLFRVGCYNEAYEAAETLNRNHANSNSRFVLHFAKSLKMNEALLGTEYWYLEQSKKNLVVELIDETIQLYKENKEDARLFNIIIPCLIYVKRSHVELERICLDNIDKVTSFDNEFADDLKLKNNKKDLSTNHPIKLIEKSLNDDTFKRELISQLTSKLLVSYNDLRMLSNLLSFDEFETWVKKGVKIDGDFTDLGIILNEIFVALTIKNKEIIKTLIKKVLKHHNQDLRTVNPEFVSMLAQSMQGIDLFYDSCDLLLACFDGLNDIWFSHYVESILISLYNSARYKDFIEFYERINNQEISSILDNLAIYVQFFHNSPDEAFRLIHAYRHENNLDFIRLKLLVYSKIKRNDLIELEVNGFDYSLFSPPSPIMKDIVSLLIKCNQLLAYEKIIINWFIDSPEKNYKYISDACLSFILDKKNKNFTPSYNIQGINKAIRYKDGDRYLTKLLSSGSDFMNPHILNPGSNLFSAFANAKVGDEVTSGLKTLKIEEILPPYIAIHRISISIRENFNDGSDHFQSFNVSSNPDELMEQLKKIIGTQKHADGELQSVLNNSLAPLNFRMSLLDKAESVRSALHLLTSKSVKINDFIDIGDENVSEMCTDVITVVYLCLTSFSEYFIQKNLKLFILQEDIDAISKWVNSIESNEFMVMGGYSDGSVYINTAETVKKHFGNFLLNISNLLKILHPLKIVLDNYSSEVIALSDSFGTNFAKKIYAVKNSGLPYFSIDSQNCFLNRALVPIELVNANKLLNHVRKSVPFNVREPGLILHIHGGMPYPLTVEDFTMISTLNSDEHGLHLSELIKKYTGRFNKSIRISHLMASLFINYFNKSVGAWRYDELIYAGKPYGPRIDKVFNSACTAVINDNEGGMIEYKLAKFFFILFNHPQNYYTLRYLIRELAFNFCTGHFLNLRAIENYITDIADGKIKI